ncbi:hypothetical protein BV20DRAFT_454925 [Pilatotrama ljubarskyi]|nr:hypothetical protein BV20DRAFT_454925 [Pilatotrama ljubarskyi]
MPRTNDSRSVKSSDTRGSGTTLASQSTPATTPENPPAPLPPAGNFLDMTQTPDSSVSGGSAPPSTASSPPASVYGGTPSFGSPSASARSPTGSVISYSSAPDPLQRPAVNSSGPSSSQARQSGGGRGSLGGHAYQGQGTSPSQSSLSSPGLPPGMGYYDQSPSQRAYQSPALPSSGVPSQHVSPSHSAFQGTPLMSSGVNSHYTSPSRALDATYPVHSPAMASSRGLPYGSQSNSRPPMSGAMSPLSLDPYQPNVPRAGGNNGPAGQVAVFPSPPTQTFGGAFPTNPQHARTGSNPIPRPGDPQYELRARSQSGGEQDKRVHRP